MGSLIKRINKFIDDLAIKRVLQQKSSWSKLWLMIQESRLFGKKVTRPYQEVANIFKAVKAIADNAPQAKLKFYDRKTNEEITPDNRLVDLINQPQEGKSYNDFIQEIVGFYALYGECFIIKEYSLGEVIGTSKIPAELWTDNPAKFEEVKSGKFKCSICGKNFMKIYPIEAKQYCRKCFDKL